MPLKNECPHHFGVLILNQAADALSATVLETAKKMESKPAGEADFFETLKSGISQLSPETAGRFNFKDSSPEYVAAVRRYGPMSHVAVVEARNHSS